MKKSFWIFLLFLPLLLVGCSEKQNAAAATVSGQMNYSEQTIAAVQKADRRQHRRLLSVV